MILTTSPRIVFTASTASSGSPSKRNAKLAVVDHDTVGVLPNLIEALAILEEMNRNRVPQFCRDLTCFHFVYLPFTYLWFQAALPVAHSLRTTGEKTSSFAKKFC
jgi:hypothetical protein